ncbi:uncharacterized protein FIBRA_06979 [Fibroporia radiculosa]|uniref:RING-type E3 ubiquitin transferase (cysteine targeting) n=1 Tax=Fibroporia radiculosa TaxID=599839 RepID=J4IBJ8_9APHY|nr:uncharacterized protein FIBRA_06979 [Fibroporia radiculosa]CCM04786.1 predicted protein [Fibroporia radiculosa]
MSSPVFTSWQQAWDNAQPRLSLIKETLISSTIPTPRVTRVGQLDAELLDQELVQLLKEPLVKAISLLNSAWKARFEPELVLLIQLILYKFSVWDIGASYGAKLQGLKYAGPRFAHTRTTVSELSYRTLFAHGTATLLVPYFYTRLRAHALSHAWPDAPSSDTRRKAWELLSRLESLHGLLALSNFVVFLWNGRYRTVIDRLLGLRLVSARRMARRDVSYEFMNRQMVWHAFTEFLLFLLPLINTRALRRRLTNVFSRLRPAHLLPKCFRSIAGLPTPDVGNDKIQIRKGRYWALPQDQCAICAENASPNLNFSDPANALNSITAMPTYDSVPPASKSSSTTSTPDVGYEPPTFPIHNPYITSCGHAYCYYCLSERMMRTVEDRSGGGAVGTQWECLRCNDSVIYADKAEAKAEGPEYESGVDDGEMEYDYSSEDMDFTDMSGSVGSYSVSGNSE